MKKFHVSIIIFLVVLATCIAIASCQAKAQTTPTVTITPAGPVSMDVTQPVTFTAHPVGGSDSFSSFQWEVNSVVVQDGAAQSFTYSPPSPGSYLVTVTVTDSLGATSIPASVSVSVAASPTVQIMPLGPFTLDVGQSQLLTAIPSGGSAPINYQWFLGGAAISGQTSATYTFSQTTTGPYTVTCKVTDSASTPIISPASNAVTFTVNPALNTPTASATPQTITLSQLSTLSITGVSGGTPPYHYQWLQKAPGAGSYSTINGATSSKPAHLPPPVPLPQVFGTLNSKLTTAPACQLQSSQRLLSQ